MSFFRSRIFVACVASTVTALVVGGIAWAAQSPVDGNGVVNGCYNPKTGAMHLNVTGSCPKTGQNTPITWSATGPQGEPGPAGASVTPIFAKLDVSNQQAVSGSSVPIIASSHIVSAKFVTNGGGTGLVGITFDRDVSLCAMTALAINNSNTNGQATVYGGVGAYVIFNFTGSPVEFDVVATCTS